MPKANHIDARLKRMAELANEPDTESALRALAPNRFYTDIRQRVQTAIEATKNRRLRAIFRELFGSN